LKCSAFSFIHSPACRRTGSLHDALHHTLDHRYSHTTGTTLLASVFIPLLDILAIILA